MRRVNSWTREETATLIRQWPEMTAKEIHRYYLPGRTLHAIQDKAVVLHLDKQRHLRLRASFSVLAEQIALAREERATAAPYKNPRAWEEL